MTGSSLQGRGLQKSLSGLRLVALSWLLGGDHDEPYDADHVAGNEVTGDGLALKYNKHYVGLARGGIADNFVTFPTRKAMSSPSSESHGATTSQH
jgi:hypothetical protein